MHQAPALRLGSGVTTAVACTGPRLDAAGVFLRLESGVVSSVWPERHYTEVEKAGLAGTFKPRRENPLDYIELRKD